MRLKLFRSQRALVYGRNHRAFSLIELVIVVVIIGIIAAIAIPRLSRGAEGAADAALIGDLAVMRGALDLFVTEHTGVMPTAMNFEDSMLLYSNDVGGTNSIKGGGYIYGPYLRAIPPLPVGVMKGNTGIKAPPADGVGGGWIYDIATISITANTTVEADDSGKPYNTY